VVVVHVRVYVNVILHQGSAHTSTHTLRDDEDAVI